MAEIDEAKSAINKNGLVVLVLLDGWGIAPLGVASAFTEAKWPNLREYIQQYPLTALSVGGQALITAREAYSQIGSGQNNQAIPGLGDRADQPGIAELLAGAGLHQVYISETEKFPLLVDYLANGYREANIDYRLISTPLNSDSAGQPLSASQQVVEQAVRYWHDRRPDFMVVSLAGWSIAAASGNQENVSRAIAAMDKLLPKLINPLQQAGATVLLTSAYGRLESLLDPLTEQVNFGPSQNPVPLVFIGQAWQGQSLGESEIVTDDLSVLPIGGSLRSITPTVLTLLGVERPDYLIDPLMPAGFN